MKLLKASDLEVISGAWGKGDRKVELPGVLPCGHTGFRGKIAMREDLERQFIQFEIKATVTKTDDFVALEHPEEQNPNTKALLNDRTR